MQKKQKKQEKKTPKYNTHFWGGLENGQEVVPPFFPQKVLFFSKILKNPIFIAFPEKWVATTFFPKRLCYKEDTFKGAKKMITFWGLIDRNL